MLFRSCVCVHVRQDLVLSLSLLTGDSVAEKLDWTFRLYDLNGDGVISRDELVDIVVSIYELVGDCAEPPLSADTVQQHTDAVFQVRSFHSHQSHAENSQRR